MAGSRQPSKQPPGSTPRGPTAELPRVSLRIDLGPGARIGPGKIALLEQIGASGSISAAGRALGMSYRRAWDLVADMNSNFGARLVETSAGGPQGGGAGVTEAGLRLIAQYRDVERGAAALAASRFGQQDGPASPDAGDDR
jgi:molybdate transport system regulatory protein